MQPTAVALDAAVRTWNDYAPRVPFRLGVVTNEISHDIGRACAVAAAVGVTDLELNTVWDRSITDLSDDDARRARDVVQAHGLRVSQIIGPAFKAVPLEAVAAPGAAETAVYAKHRQTLERAAQLAHLFGTDRVRVFAFRRAAVRAGTGIPAGHPFPPLGEAELDALRRGFGPLLQLAAREGVTLMVENVRYSYADTGAHSRQILDALDSPRVKLIWDPANAYVSGEDRPYPDGYGCVAPYVGQVHAKDARFLDRAAGTTAWERIGDGEVDWAGQLRALLADGYAGVVSLETHWRLPGDSGERSTLETWRGLAGCLDRALGG